MAFPWHEVEWVLLDMDGTLLDKYFDDYFWETLVPEEYGRRRGLDPEAARREVYARYQREEGTLNWTDIDFWSRELDLDIPALKAGIRHLIEVHPDSEAFLQFLRNLGKKIVLVTNAHYKTLDLKMSQVGLLGYFDQVISSFDLGMPKEEVRFWQVLAERFGIDPQRAVLIDDNQEVLQAAQRFGLKYLFFKAKPSSRTEAEASDHFPMVLRFRELMT
ncbi:MAG: GMP/IMP nucleotidase [Desulfobacteraceae bacterium]